MKRLLLYGVMIFITTANSAQVRIKPEPSPGFEKRITDFIESMPVVDTHEHLLSTEELKRRGALDFMVLLTHYSADDLKSAGMSEKTFKLLIKDSLSVPEKWKIIEPYWDASSNTAYNRIALLAADKLYNISDINISTVIELSDKISKAYQSDWITKVLDKGKIDYVVQMNPGRTINDKRFREVIWLDNFINVSSKAKINSIAKARKTTISTLDEYLKALEGTFKASREQGVIAIKSALAYNRILFYENVSREKATEIFNIIINTEGEKPLPFDVVKPLQDYIMHRVLDLASSNKVPFIFHTGLQSGNGNQIENSNPTHLVNLFKEYPGVDFILLHGGYPFGGEIAATVKYFRNVYIDLAWLYAISPSFSERYLHEWLETVPVSKIMAFGGDYFNVESLYAHLLFAKQIVSNVLIAKVRDGYFSEQEAINIAKKILHDNAVRIYKINP